MEPSVLSSMWLTTSVHFIVYTAGKYGNLSPVLFAHWRREIRTKCKKVTVVNQRAVGEEKWGQTDIA